MAKHQKKKKPGSGRQKKRQGKSSLRLPTIACGVFLLGGAVLAGVVAVVCMMPSHVDPVAFSYSDDPIPEYTGALSINDRLTKARKVFENEFLGPEAFAQSDDGYIYTGLGDQRIMRFDSHFFSFETVAQTGDPKSLSKDVSRPLGLAFHPKDQRKLYVADSYKGILTVDVKTGRIETLVDANNPGQGVAPMKLVDDLKVLSNGSIFFTDLSYEYPVHEIEECFTEGRPQGRLIHYNPTDGSLHTVMDGLYGANGVCLSPDEAFVLVTELGIARIKRYYLKGPLAGTTDTFADNLPGLPDNITPSSTGGYWVSFAMLRKGGLLDYLASMPWLRKVLLKLKLMPFVWARAQTQGLVVELNQSGQIVQSLFDSTGESTTAISSVLDLGEKGLLLGSFFNPYIVYCENCNE